MKRGEPLRRFSPLRAENPALSGSAALGRGKVPPRHPKREKPRMSLNTARVVWIRTRGRCAVPGCGRMIAPPPIGYHHVFPKAKWPALTDDPSNIVGLCIEHHANHESAAERLPMAVTDLALEQCATADAMVAYLARTYR